MVTRLPARPMGLLAMLWLPAAFATVTRYPPGQAQRHVSRNHVEFYRGTIRIVQVQNRSF
jgi:hypothetical protein